MIQYDRALRRVKIAGHRLHHGMTGCILLGFSLVLIAHDWHDRHLWMRGLDG